MSERQMDVEERGADRGRGWKGRELEGDKGRKQDEEEEGENGGDRKMRETMS